MSKWRRLGWVSAVALVIGAVGCGSKDTPSTSSASATSAGTGDKKPVASASQAPSAASSAKSAKKEVDVDDILADKGGKKSGALKVDLSKIKDADAPPLGGGSDTPTKPPEPAPGKQLEWLPAGSVEIPNPAWKKESQPEKKIGMLTSPDEKAIFIFQEFSDEADGQQKVDKAKDSIKLNNLQWQEPKIVKLGPDELPAAVGLGEGTDAKDKKIVILYAMIETGEENHNLLVFAIGEDDAPKETQDDAEQILLNIRKKKAD